MTAAIWYTRATTAYKIEVWWSLDMRGSVEIYCLPFSMNSDILMN
jgi:hypothetical protein